MGDFNLKERNIYITENENDIIVSHVINELGDSMVRIKGSSKSLKEVKKNVVRLTNIIYNVITSMLIIMVLNLMVNLTIINKLFVYVILVIIHIYGLSVCKEAENLFSEHKTRRYIREAKNTSLQLQTTLEEKISKLTLQLQISAEDSKVIHKAANKVIIKAGVMLECDYPYVAKLLISIFKNGALFASFIVCSSNLLLIAAILICDRIMVFPCPVIFEQLKEVQMFHIGVYVLIMDIVIQAYNLSWIQKGSLISNQLDSWIRKLDELDREIELLQSNSALFKKLKYFCSSNS